MLRQAQWIIRVKTPGRGLVDVTQDAARWAGRQGVSTGLLTLFCRHTSASLLVQENASPAAARDLAAYFETIAPEAPGHYEHDEEGDDDMPAHIRAALTTVSVGIPVVDGRLALGTWQGVFVFEHRRRPQEREVVMHLVGE